jgi:hypothetical protein
MKLFSTRKPFVGKSTQEDCACSNSVNVTRPIEVCHGYIRELILLLDVQEKLVGAVAVARKELGFG